MKTINNLAVIKIPEEVKSIEDLKLAETTLYFDIPDSLESWSYLVENYKPFKLISEFKEADWKDILNSGGDLFENYTKRTSSEQVFELSLIESIYSLLMYLEIIPLDYKYKKTELKIPFNLLLLKCID